jgi:hypothetical protein
MEQKLIGRTELAALLSVSENTARAIERSGAIRPVQFAGKRPLFNAAEAAALRARRDAIEAARRAAINAQGQAAA